MIIKANTSFLGRTGYNYHSRNFFTELDKHIPVRVKNFSYDSNPDYLTSQMKKMLVEQTLKKPNGEFGIYPFEWSQDYKWEDYDVEIVLNEVNHHYFYDKPDAKKRIAYTVWEATELSENFFKCIQRYDQIWVPTKWQKECFRKQGIPEYKLKIVPEGLCYDEKSWEAKRNLFPISKNKEGKFRFGYFGRWDYRKSTEECVRAFIEVFGDSDEVELIISADNPFAQDGIKDTKEKLEKLGLNRKNIIPIKFKQDQEAYLSTLNSCHVYLSCARSEGWNRPLHEAMGLGIPSLYSNWGGQLEFAEGLGVPVEIWGEEPAKTSNNFNTEIAGNYCKPNFEDLKRKMLYVKNNYEKEHKKAISEIHKVSKFTWKNAANIAKKYIEELVDVKLDVNFQSSSIGDTLGWMPYVDAYQKKIGTRVNVKTAHENLFKKSYPNLNFTSNISENSINIGYYLEDLSKHKNDPRKQPLQKIASDYLGLDFEELRPKIDCEVYDRPIKEKYVAIAVQSTAQCKYWNNSDGWDEVINYLNLIKGYKVICVDLHEYFGVKGCLNKIPQKAINRTGKPIEDTINTIYHAEFFIGLSSGLSWISWALNKPTVMISGFTKEFNEFSTPYRVINKNVCHGCWNDDNIFDRGDWFWCPKHKNTPRMFECSSEITSDMVIEQINKITSQKSHTLTEGVNGSARKTLYEISLSAGTDKATTHSYIPFYEYKLEMWRDVNFNLIEIGVGQGCSLKMWREYFSKARIIGIDINDAAQIEGVEIYKADAKKLIYNPILKELDLNKTIIIDDGSNKLYDQAITAGHLAKKVRGYFIEDIGGASMNPDDDISYLSPIADFSCADFRESGRYDDIILYRL